MNIKTLLQAALLCPGLASGASLFQPVEVSDNELAELRGRFTLPDRIVQFGVTMTSYWQNGSGDVIGATVALQIGQQAQANLTVTPIIQAGNGQLPGIGNGQVLGGAGLGTVQGVAQSVRTAGDFNNGRNDLEITLSQAALPAASGQSWSGSPQQFSSAAGTVTLSSVGGGIQLALLANQNQGAANQAIANGSVRQMADISGTLNQVHNAAALNVVLRERAQNLQEVYCNWDQIRALRPAHY